MYMMPMDVEEAQKLESWNKSRYSAVQPNIQGVTGGTTSITGSPDRF